MKLVFSTERESLIVRRSSRSSSIKLNRPIFSDENIKLVKTSLGLKLP